MKRFIRIAVLTILALAIFIQAPKLYAVPEGHGGEHAGKASKHHAVVSWDEIAKPLAYRIINLVIFVGALVFFLRKPISQALINRRKEIEEIIKSSAERKAWAEQMYVDYDRRFASIGKEIEELKTSLRQEGETESKNLLEHARKLAEDMKREATQIAGADLEDFKIRLRHEVVEKAAKVAKETVVKAITDQDQERLTRDFVGEIRSRHS